MSFSLIVVAFATLLIFWFFTKGKRGNKKGLKEIPGPRGLPVLGNVLQLGKRPTVQYCKWVKQYGSIYKVKLGSEELIVVSDPKLHKEMFSNPLFTGKKALEAFAMHKENINAGVFATEGESWEVHRRFLLRQLRDFGFGKSSMETLIMENVNEVLERFKGKVGKPVGKLKETFRLAVVNSLLSILSSIRLPHDDPYLLKLAVNTSDAFNEMIEKGGLLIFMPWVRHIIPELSGYNAIRKVLEENKAVFRKIIADHKSNFQEDNLRDYIDVYLAETKKTTDPKSHFYGVPAEQQLTVELFDTFFAGSDSSSVTLTWIILYLCKNPSVQKKLQEEIKNITGNSRKVSVADKPNMPYTLALIDESLRCSSFVPDGVPHRVMENTEFNGYFIAKNTLVQPNLYYIHTDPKLWGDPLNFRPERFLSEDGKKYVKNENLQSFQVGRRQCVGEALARDTLFLYTTNLFQQFSMEFDPASPEPSVTDIEFGFFRIPRPFSVVMKDRLTN